MIVRAYHPSSAADVVHVPPVVAHKFGGSSVADAKRYRRVASLLCSQPEHQQITIVSAMRHVTDVLIQLADAAHAGQSWHEPWERLRAKHMVAAQSIGGPDLDRLLDWLVLEFEELAGVLGAIGRLGSAGDGALGLVHGLGEVWSAALLRAALVAQGADAAVLDARDVLVVRHTDMGVAVDWELSATRLQAWRNVHRHHRVVVTGFVARQSDGKATTLGRNGSDFSGAIFAALFHASALHIWTDVDGVLSADPQAVPDAVLLPRISYDEARELAYFGAKVIHPQTIAPAMARQIPIWIRNTFNADHPGTRIDANGETAAARPVKGLALVTDLALLNVEGHRMIGDVSMADWVIRALHAQAIPTIMISQGSSADSIGCVIPSTQLEESLVALRRAFPSEIAHDRGHSITTERDISVLAAVGDGMVNTPGVAARFFSALARAGVNVRAIAQGASERNISVAVASSDARKALRAAHAGFWLSPQTVAVGVIGCGKVGATLLEQIAAAHGRLAQQTNLDLRLCAVADSRRMVLTDGTAAPSPWREQLENGVAYDLDDLVAHVRAVHVAHTVMIDCTASPTIAARYADWLSAGIHVVTPNKHAGSGPLSEWHAIQAAAQKGRAHFRYEATVGAGLPIISTLRDLLDTGDELIAIDGVLSGTLAWLLNRYDGRRPFSDLLREAQQLGYTEPDIRHDLSGTDVARKLVILAREAGRELSLDDVQIDSLIPGELMNASATDLLAGLDEFDEVMRKHYLAAAAAGKVLRYVARLDAAGAHVGLVALPSTHAFARLQSSDNVVQFTTRRYCENPLVVLGPGAGPAVTAAGVFADLLRLGATLGAQR